MTVRPSSTDVTPPAAADPAPVVAVARRWLGTPYVHQASLRGAGCDCLGLIRGIWREVVGDEPERPPPYAPFWGGERGDETLLAAARRHLLARPDGADPRPGDVLLFRYRAWLPARHAAVLETPGMMIHAREGVGVVREPFAPWWRRHLAGVFAFPQRK